ncbi:hypothetical protein MIMGU_mgv11b015395mg [Erythranthe guttata]|uniref:Uncharacterized protein n=1 Tax=Erythranthe guttata TaxID=4155 RepID=A0A022PX56_ERYGU|nr:hypothetical protein MIMGU_mgv11b015395mg [Erythranthe guttata]
MCQRVKENEWGQSSTLLCYRVEQQLYRRKQQNHERQLHSPSSFWIFSASLKRWYLLQQQLYRRKQQNHQRQLHSPSSSSFLVFWLFSAPMKRWYYLQQQLYRRKQHHHQLQPQQPYSLKRRRRHGICSVFDLNDLTPLYIYNNKNKK